jgi:protein pelota
MIVTEFNPRHGHCSLVIESTEDLWILRRLISIGDTIVTRSSRVVKREDEYSRPDKGERVKVTVALSVAEVHLDSSIERIRVKGTIVEASDESVGKAGSHSITISPGNSLTLRKEKWTGLDIKLVHSASATSRRFVLVAIDRRDAGVGTLSGSHLSVLTTIESGLSGKMSEEQSSKPYFAKVEEIVSQTYREGDEVVVAGPGNTKSAFVNALKGELGGKASVRLIEGFDMTGSDGVRSLVKAPSFQQVAKDSALVEMQKLVEEAVRRISMGDRKVAYTLPRVKEAAVAGAVESCAVSDNVFSSGVNEDQVVATLNLVEEKGGSVHLADSSLEFGKQISSFGGIIALLRYPIRLD